MAAQPDHARQLNDLTRLDIAGAAASLARGDVTASALTELYLNRIRKLDGRLNSYVTVLEQSARAEAAAADRRRQRLSPLDGIPIAIKDNTDVAGAATTNGLARRPVPPPAEDAEVVRRLRDAGAVVLGKLNMHEGALGGTTDNPHHGRTHNPWRQGYTPGGSSGGSGAAVAARLCAAALGSDTLGSVRLPAAYCGVAGLKPTYGLISKRGVHALSWRLDHVGMLCRSVRDLGIMLDVMAAFDADDIDSVEAPAAPAVARQPLRIGVAHNFRPIPLDPEIGGNFESCLDLVRTLGHDVVEVELPGLDPAKAAQAGFLVTEADAAVFHEAELERHPEAFSLELRRMLEFGRNIAAGRLIKAERTIQGAAFALRQAWRSVDLIASPTAPQAAFSFDDDAPANQIHFTALANLAGCPAVSIPSGFSRAGLPIGLQLIAPAFHERKLLAFAEAVERALDLDLMPPLDEGDS